MRGERYRVEVSKDPDHPSDWVWEIRGARYEQHGYAPSEDVARRIGKAAKLLLEGRDPSDRGLDWYQARVDRLSAWAREELGNALKNRFFAILANGSADVLESPRFRDRIESVIRERDTARAEVERLRARIADLEHYVGEYLGDMGACSGSDSDGDESLCTDPSCSYCEMARALQPGLCGRPLMPRDEEGGEHG